MKEYPFKDIPGLNNIEAEEGETIQLPDGRVFKISGKKHTKGGEKMVAPPGSRVFSQYLKLDSEVTKELTGTDTGQASPAELSKKYDPTKFLSILKEKDSPRTDDLRKSTAQYMATKKLAQQDAIFAAQENHKDYNKSGKMKYGGKVKQFGGPVDPTKPLPTPTPTQVFNRSRGYMYPAQNNNPQYWVSYGDTDLNNSRDFTLELNTFDTTSNITSKLNTLFPGRHVGPTKITRSGPLPLAEDTTLSLQAPDTMGVAGPKGFRFPGKPTVMNSQYRNVGMSIPDPNDPRLIHSQYNPFHDHPFFREGTYKKRGKLEGKDRDNLLSYQKALSYPEEELGLNPRLAKQFNQQLATHLRESTKNDPDKFLDFNIDRGGKLIPLEQATDDDIANGELRMKNLRTGEDNLIDGRNGNLGESTHNQNFFPFLDTVYATTETVASPLDPIQTLKPLDIPARELGVTDPKEVTEPSTKIAETKVSEEDLLYAIQQGLDLGSLLTLEKTVPQYQFSPQQTAAVRFDPINRLAQDRGFNVAKEALDATNLPEQVKAAQLNSMYASNIEGRTQTDLTNYQNDLQVDNINTQMVMGATNTNRDRRVQANEVYLQQLAQARFIEEQQKQVHIDRLLENYRNRLQDKETLSLLDQSSNNYRYNPATRKVEYVPGQGVSPDFNLLSNYGSQ